VCPVKAKGALRKSADFLVVHKVVERIKLLILLLLELLVDVIIPALTTVEGMLRA